MANTLMWQNIDPHIIGKPLPSLEVSNRREKQDSRTIYAQSKAKIKDHLSYAYSFA